MRTCISVVMVIILMFPATALAAPSKGYLAHAYPHLYRQELWEVQERLQETYRDCDKQGKWVGFRNSRTKSLRCYSEQRWAVRAISKWY